MMRMAYGCEGVEESPLVQSKLWILSVEGRHNPAAGSPPRASGGSSPTALPGGPIPRGAPVS